MDTPRLVTSTAVGSRKAVADRRRRAEDPERRRDETGQPEPEVLLAETIDRAFDGDARKLERFVGILAAALPSGTKLYLRGSAVAGENYVSGEPFDSRGPGTSDLDVVVIGEEAMALYDDEAFYCPGINSRPLCDHDRLVAPALDAARSAAQAVAGRPVSIQAMTEWFLELRSAIQGTPHLALGESRA